MVTRAGHNLEHNTAQTKPKLLNQSLELLDSQSSNRGSIPGSATKHHPLRYAKSAGFVFAQKLLWRVLPLKKRVPWHTKWVHRPFARHRGQCSCGFGRCALPFNYFRATPSDTTRHRQDWQDCDTTGLCAWCN